MIELILSLGFFAYAGAYYLATARIFQAPRTFAHRWLGKTSKALAESATAAYSNGARLGKPTSFLLGSSGIFLALLRVGLLCRKCWAQAASWAGLVAFRGSPHGWSVEEFGASIGGAGAAILAYELTQPKETTKPLRGDR